MEQFAYFYVTFLEPALKFFAFFMIVMAAIWFLNFIHDSKKYGDMAVSVFQGTIKGFVVTVQYIGLGLWWVVMFFVRIVRLFLATLRDFFTSRI